MRLPFILCTLLVVLSSCKQNSTVHPVRKNIIETVYASGTIIPENEHTVYSLVNGTIVEKRVTDGDSLSKNEILYVVRNEAQTARLDAAKQLYENATLNTSDASPVIADLRLAMQSAESKFKTDSVQYIRYQKLLDSNVITHSQFDDISNAYTISLNNMRSTQERYRSTLHDLRVTASNAKSQVAAAETDLDNFYIRTDTDGAVFQTLKEVGEAVRMSEPVALLGSKERRTIKLAVDQQDIDKISVGQQVLLKNDVTGNTIYEARVVKIYPTMNVADQTFRVDAEFTIPSASSFVHSSVEANIIIRKKTNALVIPRQSLLSGDSVFVISSGTKKTVAVKSGILTLDDAEILSGIDEHTEIVLPGQ
ncbi:MAG TPA: HlyD family efflux transporter periplasmic adaptor subunit [Candidatus Kapabacteria bacterium]|nr:HlyD family efflux transporter periplasmic adaptor subunit [Candidatus Kapabacteria bacterium]